MSTKERNINLALHKCLYCILLISIVSFFVWKKISPCLMIFRGWSSWFYNGLFHFIIAVSVVYSSALWSPSDFRPITAQKTKFSIEDFFSKCGQIWRKLQIWSHLLKKFIFEKFVFCAVYISYPVREIWDVIKRMSKIFIWGIFLKTFFQSFKCLDRITLLWLLEWFSSPWKDGCANTELFLARIFLNLDWIRVNLSKYE